MALVSGRMLVGTTIMLIILKLRSGSLSGKIGDWRTFFISGMTGNIIPFLLISYGETNVGSGLAAIFMGITPVATVLIAPLFLPDEKLTAASIASICLGAAGLVILVGPGALSGIGDHVIGQISIIGAALCYAFTTIYVRKFATRPPLEMATGSMLTGTIVIVIATLVFESPVQFSQPSTSSFVALVYLGIFPTACATLIYFYLVPRLGASRMSQVKFFCSGGWSIHRIFSARRTDEPIYRHCVDYHHHCHLFCHVKKTRSNPTLKECLCACKYGNADSDPEASVAQGEETGGARSHGRQAAGQMGLGNNIRRRER
jgi:drug/metabolite transporter (DMT)-like permease